MDDLMKAILAKSEQEIAKSKKSPPKKAVVKPKQPAPQPKPVESVKVVKAKDEPPAPVLRPIPVPESWSAEMQETSILPAMLEPQTSEPVEEKEHQDDAQNTVDVTEESKHHDDAICNRKTETLILEPIRDNEHQNDAGTEQVEELPPVSIVKAEKPKLETGVKIYWIFSCSAFIVAVTGAAYTILKVMGVL